MSGVVQAALTALAPAGVLWLARRFAPVRWVGPVVLCYAIGILARNVPGLPLSGELSGGIAEATVPLALPLLLVPTDMRQWLHAARPTLLSFAFACAASFAAALFFGTWGFDDLAESNKVLGMLAGVYIGGTANLTAVGLALDVNRQTYVQLNAADVVAGGLYLLVMVTVAHRAARFVLRKRHSLSLWERGGVREPGSREARPNDTPAPPPNPLPSIAQLAVGAGLGIAIVAVSAGVTYLLFRELAPIPLLLALTVLGLGASLIPRLRGAPGAPFVGEYALLVFCVGIGTMVDLGSLATGSPTFIVLCLAVTTLAMALHLGLARLTKLDPDTVMITSTAAILGPAFVPAVANAIGNRGLVASGVAMGLAGLALGTWAGLAVAWLLG